MKMLILALVLLSPLARALPVLNENAVTNGSLITLWPDHEDKNVFYYAPSWYETLRSEDERSYISAYPGFKIFAVHKAMYNPALEQAVSDLKAENPAAIVKPVTFKSGHIKESSALSEFISQQKCTVLPNHGNGACLLVIHESSFRLIESIIANMGITLQVEYEVEGVIRSDNDMIKSTATFGIPLLIKGVLNDLTDL